MNDLRHAAPSGSFACEALRIGRMGFADRNTPGTSGRVLHLPSSTATLLCFQVVEYGIELVVEPQGVLISYSATSLTIGSERICSSSNSSGV